MRLKPAITKPCFYYISCYIMTSCIFRIRIRTRSVTLTRLNTSNTVQDETITWSSLFVSDSCVAVIRSVTSVLIIQSEETEFNCRENFTNNQRCYSSYFPRKQDGKTLWWTSRSAWTEWDDVVHSDTCGQSWSCFSRIKIKLWHFGIYSKQLFSLYKAMGL